MNSDATNDAQGLDDAAAVAVLTGIEHQLAAAWVAGDSSFHERVLADDWSVIDGSGRVLTKAEVLRESFAGEREITVGQIDEIRVRLFDGWAVVTGRTHIAGRYRGAEIDIKLRFTDVSAQRGGAWQVVASQATLLNA
ncbi:MAG TPA: nuclear transport factor 2 family protein [Pyrinomonadaceae bacterium]|jgi:hypothetical protein